MIYGHPAVLAREMALEMLNRSGLVAVCFETGARVL